jgi:dynein heavy chain 2
VFNFNSLYGIFEEGIYGGRVDNAFDLRVLRAYLKKYFNSQILSGAKEIMPGMPLPKTAK